MEAVLTPDQRAFVRSAIEEGRLQSEEDALREALAMWEERERRRVEILCAVADAEASLERGEGRRFTQESLRELTDDVKRRGRERMAARASIVR